MTPLLNIKASLIVLAFGLTACQPTATTQSDARRSTAMDARFLVQSAHAALNADDVEAFAATVEFPLHIRTQEWALGKDGAFDFYLLPAEEKVVNDLKSLKENGFVTSVSLASNPDDGVDYTREQLKYELEGADSIWSTLSLTLFVRGTGDVEHIVVFGSDPMNGKVRAVYAN